MNFWTRKRHKINPAPVTFVQGDILTPGAEAFAPVPDQANPIFQPLVNAVTFCGDFLASQPGLVNQGLALVDSPVQGFPYDGVVMQGLVDPNNYPNIYVGMGGETNYGN